MLAKIYPNIRPLSVTFYTAMPYKADPYRRGRIQYLLGSMCQCPEFLKLSEDEQSHMVAQIEKSCLNITIQKANTDHFEASWENPLFKRSYAILIMEIVDALDYAKHQYLTDKLLGGEIKASEVGGLQMLVPKSEIHHMLDQRRTVKLERKTTSLYTCPNCGQKKATFQEVQLRSADEGKDTQLECVFCGHKWIERC